MTDTVLAVRENGEKHSSDVFKPFFTRCWVFSAKQSFPYVCCWMLLSDRTAHARGNVLLLEEDGPRLAENSETRI